ncbi:mitochondrial import inner membrane translocase subunit TIM16 [Scheffersomyces spartinae]|uniref:Mitochondrial import inner membrane translocase subunit TIM16 n=1 Tax=Scheffersomyces spartinae TaxID=45513 RepID=A0A9P8AGG7_9ASCO|nr:mitochondrial import inner membrane translocase subunit TIM16 [Scheffersomyces spartinae]KAG7191365.1 mitochondrial import inner membrane translocase subunit TIM16 [Scheffersomyces spartinae]
MLVEPYYNQDFAAKMLVWNNLWLIFLAIFHLTAALPVGESSKYVAERGIDEDNDAQVLYLDKRDNALLDTFFTQLNKSGLGVQIVHEFYSNPLTQPTVLNLINGFLRQVDFVTLLDELSSSGLAHDVAMLMFYNKEAFPDLFKIIQSLRLDGTIPYKKREYIEKRGLIGDILGGVGSVVNGIFGGGSSSSSSSAAAPTASSTSATAASSTANAVFPTSVLLATGSILSVPSITTSSGATTTTNGGLFGFIGGIFGTVTSDVGSVVSGVNSAVGSVASGVSGVVGGLVNTTTTSINSFILSSLEVATLTSVFDSSSIAAIATLLQLFQANKNMDDWIIALQKSGLGVLIVQDVVTTLDGQRFAVTAAHSIKKNAPQPLGTFKAQTYRKKMAHRLIVNVVLTGASVFGRAFTEAYKQAAKASASNAKMQSTKATSVGGVPVDEALKILDLERKDLSHGKIEDKYKYLFEVNSKEKGNSFYIQSKVYYAMDTLKKELDYLEKLQQQKKEQSQQNQQQQQ